jgi:hypothetical protein
LEKCAATTLSSKLVAHQKDFFAKMVVDAVMLLDELLPLNMIGVKKVTGGGLEVRIFTLYSKNCYWGPLWSATTCDSRPPIEGMDAFSTLKDL